MAADYELMIRNLLEFYDFTDKSLIGIGVGGGQFIGCCRTAKNIFAIDQDALALEQLRRSAEKNDLTDKFEFIRGDFLSMNLPFKGDVVFFEFCLHEMADPFSALKRAGELAGDVVIFDHGVDSEWAYYVVEEEKVRNSWKAVQRFNQTKHRAYNDKQRFKNYEELYAKVNSQGETAVRRIEKFRDKTDITIPFTYELALLEFR